MHLDPFLKLNFIFKVLEYYNHSSFNLNGEKIIEYVNLLTRVRRRRVIVVGVCVCVFSLIFIFTEFLRVLKTSLVS